MRNSLKITILSLLVVALSGCATRVIDKQQVGKNERIVIKFSHVVADDTPKGLAARRFAELVRQRTGGYVEVQVFPNSQLYKDGEELDALKRGDVQIIAPATSKLSELFPEWGILDLPFAFKNLDSVHTITDGAIGEKLFSKLNEQGLQGLAIWDNGFKQVSSNVRQLTVPKDFQGLRFRVMSSQVLVDQFTALGATATPIPFSDVYEAITSGKVDGQENTISNIYTQKFDNVQKYLTISNHGYIGYVVIANNEFWHSLPPDIKKVLETTMAEVTIWEREEASQLNVNQLSELKAQDKVEIHALSAAEQVEWAQALAPVYDSLANRVDPSLKDTVNSLKVKSFQP